MPNEILKNIAGIGTDNLCAYHMGNEILEEKISLQLLDLQSRGAISEYLLEKNGNFPCNHLSMDDGTIYTAFGFSKDFEIIRFTQPCCGNVNGTPIYSACGDFKKEKSLYRMLLPCSRYKNPVNSAKFFKTEPLAYGAFRVSSRSLKQIPFPKKQQKVWEKNVSARDCQIEVYPYFKYRFPYIRTQLSLGCEEIFGNAMKFVYEFKDECGTVFMKLLKYYGVSVDGRFLKYYIPVTAWLNKPIDQTMFLTIPMPEKQPLFNLDLIADAERVVICSAIEDAFILQEQCKMPGLVFTTFFCDQNNFDQVDFSPLDNKEVTLLISNHSGKALAEAYAETYHLSEYLKNIGFSEISYIQRAIEYTEFGNITSVNQLVHTSRHPKIKEDSIKFMDEPDFLSMYEKANGEIERKYLQSQDFDFWDEKAKKLEKADGEDKPEVDVLDHLLLRPMFGRGTINYISGARGVGKSCFVTALCGHMLGSAAPFLDERCWTVCTQPEGTKLNCIHLVFDTDGADGITQHKKDFAEYLKDIHGHYIVEDVAKDGKDYSNLDNYNALVSRINTLKNDKGNADGSVDILVIDTLLALGNDTDRGYTVANQLHKSFPDAVIIVIHHLNKSGKQYGTEKKLGHAATAIEFTRGKELETDGRAPTLQDPFKLTYTKTRNSHIPEDNEEFCLKLDEKGHFVVHNPVRSKEEMRQILASVYAAKKEDQKKIGRLFGVSDRTIRTWLSPQDSKE